MQRVFFFKFRRTAYTCICVGTRSIAAIQLQTLSDERETWCFSTVLYTFMNSNTQAE